MPIDLKQVLNFEGNIYEATNAVFRRAKQIAEVGDEDLSEHGGKTVSAAIDQIFSQKIDYHLEE